MGPGLTPPRCSFYPPAPTAVSRRSQQLISLLARLAACPQHRLGWQLVHKWVRFLGAPAFAASAEEVRTRQAGGAEQ